MCGHLWAPDVPGKHFRCCTLYPRVDTIFCCSVSDYNCTFDEFKLLP